MSETNAATVPVRAAGYVRVSQERNVRDCYGLASQEADVRRLVKYRRLVLVDIYREEGVSGYLPAASLRSAGRVLDPVAAQRKADSDTSWLDFEDQFPAITMKTPTDWKTLVSEIRELIRMLSEEVGRKRGGVKTTTLRTEITLEEVREAYAEAHIIDAEDVHDVAEAGLVELAPPGVHIPGEHTSDETGDEKIGHEGTDADDVDSGEEDANA